MSLTDLHMCVRTSTGSKRVQFPGIPSFSPECFAYIRNPNPSLYKNYNKGAQFYVITSFRRDYIMTMLTFLLMYTCLQRHATTGFE